MRLPAIIVASTAINALAPTKVLRCVENDKSWGQIEASKRTTCLNNAQNTRSRVCTSLKSCRRTAATALYAHKAADTSSTHAGRPEGPGAAAGAWRGGTARGGGTEARGRGAGARAARPGGEDDVDAHRGLGAPVQGGPRLSGRAPPRGGPQRSAPAFRTTRVDAFRTTL